VHVKTTDKPTGTEAELPLHLPSFSSLLTQPTDRGTAFSSKNKNKSNNSSSISSNSTDNSNGSSVDGLRGLWRPAGEYCEYTAEALAGCVDFRFKPLPPTSVSQQQPPALANENTTPTGSAATTAIACTATKLITLAVEVCLVEAAVGGGETRHPISGCPKFATFEVANSPEAPQKPIYGAEEGEVKKGETVPSSTPGEAFEKGHLESV